MNCSNPPFTWPPLSWINQIGAFTWPPKSGFNPDRNRIETGLTDPAREQDPDPDSRIRLRNKRIRRVKTFVTCVNMADRGRLWTDAETRALLEIWSQESIQRQLSGAVRNDIVFVRIVEELGRQGFRRTVQQCRVKLKALKKKYKEIADRARRSGEGNESDGDDDSPTDFPYYSQIHAVLGGRPSVAPVHLVDSCDSEVAHVFDAVTSGSGTATPNLSVSSATTPDFSTTNRTATSSPSDCTATPGPSGHTAIHGPSGHTATPGPTDCTATPGPSDCTATPGPSGCTATPGPSDCTATPGPTNRLSDDECDIPPKKKRKRTTKVQQAEKATRSMVKEMLDAQVESREVYVNLERRRIELDERRQEKEAERDREFMRVMGQMGQMMSMFIAQSMGTSFAPHVLPPNPQTMFPQAPYQQPPFQQPPYAQPQPPYPQPPCPSLPFPPTIDSPEEDDS